MDQRRYKIKYLEVDGKCLYKEWYRRLRDAKAKDLIQSRVDQMEDGNFGDHRSLPGTGGLWELRIHYGKGFRVYYGFHQGALVIVISGSEKDSQKGAIQKAGEIWGAFKRSRS